MNLKSRLTLLTLLPLVWVMLSCDDADDQREFEQQAFSSPSGYTETDAGGNIINEDPDDWRIAPMFETSVRISNPAFPNPTSGDEINIHLMVQVLDAVNGLDVKFLNNRGYLSPRSLYKNNESPLTPREYVIRFRPKDLSPDGTFDSARGLHRIFIFDYNDNLITYGDVKVGED